MRSEANAEQRRAGTARRRHGTKRVLLADCRLRLVGCVLGRIGSVLGRIGGLDDHLLAGVLGCRNGLLAGLLGRVGSGPDGLAGLLGRFVGLLLGLGCESCGLGLGGLGFLGIFATTGKTDREQGGNENQANLHGFDSWVGSWRRHAGRRSPGPFFADKRRASSPPADRQCRRTPARGAYETIFTCVRKPVRRCRLPVSARRVPTSGTTRVASRMPAATPPMLSGSGMISGQQILDADLDAALRALLGSDGDAVAALDSISEVGGGSISRTMVVRSGQRRCFVKLNDARLAAMFAAEADGLAALAACPALRVPRVCGQGVSGRHAWLALEHLALAPLRGHAAGAAAGHALAAMHRITGSHFGWPRDNFIGSSPQCNAAQPTWPLFFARQRLLPQLELAKRHRQPGRLIASGERLADALPALFVDHQPQPSLLHGDLWSGNAALDDSGRLALFDPAVYWGDRETDLAMSELFGGFPDSFHAAYREAWPLTDGCAQRKLLYQLYHVLNHLNLFGGGYLQQAERMIGRLLAETGD
jgi:fructosamine-3-kinase